MYSIIHITDMFTISGLREYLLWTPYLPGWVEGGRYRKEKEPCRATRPRFLEHCVSLGLGEGQKCPSREELRLWHS